MDIIQNSPELTKVFFLSFVSFVVALFITPFISHLLYKYKITQKIRSEAVDGKESPVYSRIHKQKEHTPTMGGIIIWGTVLIVTLIFNLSRSQTWLPLFTLVAAGGLGILDDMFNVFGVGTQIQPAIVYFSGTLGKPGH